MLIIGSIILRERGLKMNKSYIKYMPDPSGDGLRLFCKSVMIFEEKREPETPYFLVKLTVLKHEKSFSGQRPTPCFFKRFLRALRAAKNTFKNTL